MFTINGLEIESMTNEQCTNVAETAWNLANEPDTDFAASVALRDCAVTIKELQASIAELEKDAERFKWCLNQYCFADFIIHDMGKFCDTPEQMRQAIDAGMQKD